MVSELQINFKEFLCKRLGFNSEVLNLLINMEPVPAILILPMSWADVEALFTSCELSNLRLSMFV